MDKGRQVYVVCPLIEENEESDLFALERNKGLESIINNIYQTWNGEDIYQTIEEKAANFLYMIVKKRVAIIIIPMNPNSSDMIEKIKSV